jgi:hypothetical protein
MSKNQENRAQVGATLAAAFGIKRIPQGEKRFTREGSLNIGLFAGNGWNDTSGSCLQRLNFITAKITLNHNGIFGTEEELDKMLARRDGVKLRNGQILRDCQAERGIPTRYDD